MAKYSELFNMLESGYATDMVQALLDSIQLYNRALSADSCIAQKDSDNLYNMVWMLKAILKDCCGVNVA